MAALTVVAVVGNNLTKSFGTRTDIWLKAKIRLFGMTGDENESTGDKRVRNTTREQREMGK